MFLGDKPADPVVVVIFLIMFALFVLVVLIFAAVPSIIAFLRKDKNRASVVMLNIVAIVAIVAAGFIPRLFPLSALAWVCLLMWTLLRKQA